MKSLQWMAAAAVACSLHVPAQEKPELKEQNDKLSYSIGVNIGNNLKKEGLDLNAQMLAEGIKDALAGAKLRLTEDQMHETILTAQKEMTAKHLASAEKNKKEGQAFLEKNKKREGVVALPSGLQYEILKKGAGEKPKVDDVVRTNYRGALLDGTEFDSSYKTGKPTVFPLNGVIKGWTEALQLMPVGSKWKLYVPSELAYGPRGAGGLIGPNSTLVFEVELLGIEKGGKGER